MKRVVALTRLLAAAAALGASFLACVDLFHDTDGLQAPCENGACADADAPDAPPPGSSLCTTDPAAALEAAKTACAWLGACAEPFGINEPGRCMFEALRAYDCKLDPYNAPLAERADFWSCLQTASTARSCTDVRRCVFGDVNPPCDTKGDVFACPGGAGSAQFVRVLCRQDVGTPTGGENCAAVGTQCVKSGRDAEYQGCSARLPAVPADPCVSSSCSTGNQLSICQSAEDGGVEVARLDCRQGGGGRCGSGADAGPGCVALDPTDGGRCNPETPVSCSRAIAQRCRNGVFEEVDCARAGLACDARGAEVTHEACLAPTDGGLGDPDAGIDAGEDPDAGDGGTAGPCESTCLSATELRACMRGRPVTISCSERGLGPCREASVSAADSARAPACTPPR